MTPQKRAAAALSGLLMVLLCALGGAQAAQGVEDDWNSAARATGIFATQQDRKVAAEPRPSNGTADYEARFRNQATTRCMDDSSAGFRTWSCVWENHQRWYAHEWNDGTWRFQNLTTGRCIQATSQTRLRTWTCDSSTSQSWYITRWWDGTSRFESQRYRGRCIDDSSASGFRLEACNSSKFQSWWED